MQRSLKKTRELLLLMRSDAGTADAALQLIREGADPDTRFRNCTLLFYLIFSNWSDDSRSTWRLRKLNDESQRDEIIDELITNHMASVKLGHGVNRLTILQVLMVESPLRVSLMMKLVRHGASANSQLADGERRLLHLLVNGRNNIDGKYDAEIEELVKKHYALIDIQDIDGFTPLQRVMEEVPFRAEAAMKLVRLGANPNTVIVNSLVRRLEKDNLNGKNDALITELIEIYHAIDDRKDPIADLLDQFMAQKRIKEDVCAIDALRKYKFEILDTIKGLEKEVARRGFLQARNRLTTLGKIVLLERKGNREYLEKTDMFVLIQTFIDQVYPELNTTLQSRMESLFCGKTTTFDWNETLKLVQSGANPRACIRKSYAKTSKFFSGETNITLGEIFSIAWLRGQRPSIATIEELMRLGVSFNLEKDRWSPMTMVANDGVYDYALLFLKWGARSEFIYHFSRAGSPDAVPMTVLDKVIYDGRESNVNLSPQLTSIIRLSAALTRQYYPLTLPVIVNWLAERGDTELSEDTLFDLRYLKLDIVDYIQCIQLSKGPEEAFRLFELAFLGRTGLGALFHSRLDQPGSWRSYCDVVDSYYHLLFVLGKEEFDEDKKTTLKDQLKLMFKAEDEPEEMSRRSVSRINK